MSEEDVEAKPDPGHGVVIRARNGDVMRYDPSGLVMRLSDRVIADIALRLGQAPAGTSDARPKTAHEQSAGDGAEAAALDDVDAWDVRRDGGWLCFTARLPGAQGVRGFRRRVSGGPILGDGPGPVFGILGLGGPRAALARAGAPDFPFHVVAPADDIGAVGHAGIEAAHDLDTLEHLRECPFEALVADALLHTRMGTFAPLPLIVTRVETDASATAVDLSGGQAVDNLLTAARNLKAAATRIGKPARIAAVCLDYALEDRSGDARVYRDGMLALMARIEDALSQMGFDTPLFVARFESALPGAAADHVVEGQWELSWNHGTHRLIYSAPAYAFARDAFDRPTDDALAQMAVITAAALSAGPEWRAPILYLAERVADDPRVIRVVLQAETDLVLQDAFGVGAAAGFTLEGLEKSAQITDVSVAPDDAQALLVRCDSPPWGGALRLGYALRGPGSVRDGWALTDTKGATLRRWALPAILPVTDGAVSD